MIFGIYPFDGTDSEITNKIIKEEHRFPPHITVSKSCLNVINGMLEKNPILRADVHSSIFNEWYEDDSAEDFVIINHEKLIKKAQSIEPVWKEINIPHVGSNLIHSNIKIMCNLNEKEVKNSYEMQKLLKSSPSILKQGNINMVNKSTIQSYHQKDKISRKNTQENNPFKKSFDFSAIATDILGKKGQNLIKSSLITSTGTSKSQNKVKVIVKNNHNK